MKREKGLIVTIEGSDLSGKETQTQLLKERLLQEGYEVVSFSFPRYDTFIGEVITAYKNGAFGDPVEIHPKLASLPYALDRFHAKQELEQLLQEGKIIVLDRYAESNWAYQGAKLKMIQDRIQFWSWLDQLEFKVHRIPQSDRVLFLYVDPKISQQLQGTKELDMHEKNVEFQERVVKNYLYLSKRHNWRLINCNNQKSILPKEKIHEMVWQNIEELL